VNGPGPVGVIVAFTASAVQGVITAVLALAGTVAGIYATRQSILSQRRTARAEEVATSLRERTVDREDFEAVVEGLRGVLAERTAAYNELLAERATLRDELRRFQGGTPP
jgi:hypothetical protein